MQSLYVLLEVVVGLHASADYRFGDSTISDLGNTACRTIRGDTLCSPWHGIMNVGFSYFGCTLVLGALLLGSRVLPGRAGVAAVFLWCVSGMGSIGVGLLPVNEHGGLHGLVALPIFLVQPAALLMMGLSLREPHHRFARATIAVGAISAVGTIGFFTLVLLDGDTTLGGLERLALWPGYVWVSVTTIRMLRTSRSPEADGAG